jgi:hypothetical protein
VAIQTTQQRNNVATAYGTNATHGLLGTDAGNPAGGASQAATNELTATGSPAYARKALSWSGPSAGAITAAATFDVPSGTTVGYAGVASSSVVGAATLLDFVAVTAQAFASQGTYTVTYTFTET